MVTLDVSSLDAIADRRTHRPSLARSSLGSLLRTASGAFLALFLPPLLVRRLGTDAYAVWALAVEVGTYLALLDLGALSAVGHFVAGLDERDAAGRGRVVSTLLALQCALVAVGAVLLAGLVALVPVIWSRLPAELVGQARWAVGLMGASALLSLLATAVSGYFLSVHRIVVPAAITMASRLVGAVVVAALAITGSGIAVLAAAWAVTTIGGHLAVGVAFSRLRIPVRRSLVDPVLGRSMLTFCGAYGVWTLASVLVIGLDTTIVARLDFSAVAPYAAAAGVVGIVTAVYGSALAPLVPAAAELAAAGRIAELDDLFLRLVRWGATAVVAAGALLGLVCSPLLHAWLGHGLASRSVPMLQVLMAATAVRLLTFPFPVVLFGTGEHRSARWTPLIEGVVNVTASAALGLAFGPLGVAVGTLVGATVAVVVHLRVNLPRTRALSVRGAEVLRRSLLGPLAVAVPALLAWSIDRSRPEAIGPPAVVAAAVATVAVAWLVALAPRDRADLAGALSRRWHP
ncbi:MAG: polysaccharide biosynthesis protein [Acidimicrobiales bacterium]|nr:polysaccharide biosynthesis protein [Acidimicrobiales bacterium]